VNIGFVTAFNEFEVSSLLKKRNLDILLAIIKKTQKNYVHATLFSPAKTRVLGMVKGR
jgi:hypothetical protein